MPKQTCLDLRGDRLATLWRRLPERARRAVLVQYARLIARAAQASPARPGRTAAMSLYNLDRGKIRPEHRERAAYVYVRQSSPKQVREHQESRAAAVRLRRAGAGPGLERRAGRHRRRRSGPQRRDPADARRLRASGGGGGARARSGSC